MYRYVFFLFVAIFAGLPGLANAQISLFKPDDLLIAAETNDAKKVFNLVARGHSPNVVDEKGRTALMLAAMGGNSEITEILLTHRARINSRDKLGNTALFYAAGGNEVEVMEMLLDRKADINMQNRRGVSPLMSASSAGHIAAVQMLLENRANAAATDFTGRTALMWAERNNRSDMVKFLRSRGVRE